VAKEEDEVVVF